MSANITLLLIAAPIFLAVVLLRVPAAIIFFSLVTGQLLSAQVGADAQSLLSGLMPSLNADIIRLGLILLPTILSVIFLKRRVPKSKVIIEVLPAALVSLAALILVTGQLETWTLKVSTSPFWPQISTYKSLIIFAASLSSLLSVWLTYPKLQHDKTTKHH